MASSTESGTSRTTNMQWQSESAGTYLTEVPASQAKGFSNLRLAPLMSDEKHGHQTFALWSGRLRGANGHELAIDAIGNLEMAPASSSMYRPLSDLRVVPIRTKGEDRELVYLKNVDTDEYLTAPTAKQNGLTFRPLLKTGKRQIWSTNPFAPPKPPGRSHHSTAIALMEVRREIDELRARVARDLERISALVQDIEESV